MQIKTIAAAMLLATGAQAADYADFKQDLSNGYGLNYSLDVSVLAQKGTPNNAKSATQTVYAPTVSWQAYDGGTLSFSYNLVRYWGGNAARVQNDLGLANPINDFSTRQSSFDQLTFTHSFGKASITVGQFPLYNFDGSAYDSNQQTNFVNDALSQNGSETYPTAGLGAYVQINPTARWSIAAGAQNAANVGARALSTKGWGQHRFTSFGQIAYTSASGAYSVLVYNQPSVKAQPQNSTGVSVNLMQNLTDKAAVFMRINGASGDSVPLKRSYVLGGVVNFAENNQIGLAAAVNKVSRKYYSTPVRDYESVVESYWNIGVGKYLTITPDIQVYINPALDKSSKTATVFSLRGTIQL